MKTLLATLLLAASFNANAATANRDEYCLSVGDLAATFAKTRASGVKEKALADLIEKRQRSNTYEENSYRLANMLLKYVYTMELTQGDARRLGYMKCMAGQFD